MGRNTKVQVKEAEREEGKKLNGACDTEELTGSRERRIVLRQPGELSILKQLAINQPQDERLLRPVEVKLTDEDGEALQLIERPIDMDEVRQRQTEFQELERDIAELSEIMKDLNNEIVVQMDVLDEIEDKMETIEERVEKAVAELQQAARLRARRRKMQYAAWGMGIGGAVGCVAGAGGGIAIGSATVVGIPVGGIAGGAGGFVLGTTLGGAMGTGIAAAVEAGQNRSFTRKAVNMHKKEFLRKVSRRTCQHCMLCNDPLRKLGLKWARNCSICGGLFCWKCSNEKVQIKYAGLDKLVTERVCKRCVPTGNLLTN